MTTETYLRNFFKEKQIPFQTFKIKDKHNIEHFIDTEIIIESIQYTSAIEQKQIANVLRRIDFKNGSITAFLKFLAHSLVKQYSTAL